MKKSKALNIKPNYIVIPALVLLSSYISKYFVDMGLEWYDSMVQPAIAVSEWFMSIAWTTIDVLIAAALIVVWNKFKRNEQFNLIIALFAVNITMCTLWTYFFFSQHLMWPTFFSALIVLASTIWIIGLVWKKHRLVAYLLIPYALWLCYAVILNYRFIELNQNVKRVTVRSVNQSQPMQQSKKACCQ